MNRLSMDIDIAHRRRWSGRRVSVVSCSWLLVISSGLRLLLVYRIDHWLYLKRQDNSRRKWFWLGVSIPVGLLKLATKIVAKSYINNDSEIEGGISFPDQGHIIFGPKKVGSGTVIGTQVTVGVAHIECPEIGRNVWIGSNCVIYGGITIGDGATLLPDTVLTKSIPAGVVMQGNPARLVLRNFDNIALREHQNIDAVLYVNAKRELGG